MCGIVGYVGGKNATPLLLEGLKRLEYRGYDSAGICVRGKNGTLEIVRSVGKIVKLEEKLKAQPLSGSTAIAHSRWATHGAPSDDNAHPHADCGGKLVVVHNGIIENYLELKAALTAKGHVFKSQTDTEVVSHLIEEKLKVLRAGRKSVASDLLEPMFFEAVRQALSEVRGAYSLGILWAETPGVLIAAKTATPLAVGLGDGETFLASDVPAFLDHTRKVVFLEDGDIAVISTKELRVFNLKGARVQRPTVSIQWDRTMAEKGGYKHFMLKEINEQPRTVEDTLRGRLFPINDGVLERESGLAAKDLAKLREIHFVACGTAFHAGLIGRYLIERYSGMPCEVDIASEFRYRDMKLGPDTLLVAISQSGETADTLGAVREAKQSGAKVLAICNTVGSALTREADYVLYTHCGPEIGVASTKAFIGQLTAVLILNLHVAVSRGKMSEAEARSYIDDLLKLPGQIRRALKLEPKVIELAKLYHQREHFLYLGRHVNYPLALEGALKLKEISYIHAEGYAAGEMKHGPIALIDDKLPVVAIATRSRVHEKMLSNLEEAKARGGTLIVLATEGDASVRAKADHVLELPEVPEYFSPVVNAIPLQLLAYHVASLRGCDVDQPRNLAKSVTVE